MKAKSFFLIALIIWVVASPLYAAQQLTDTTITGTFEYYEFVFGKLSGTLTGSPTFKTDNQSVDMSVYDCGTGTAPQLSSTISNDGLLHTSNIGDCPNFFNANGAPTWSSNINSWSQAEGVACGGGICAWTSVTFNSTHWYAVKLVYRSGTPFNVYGTTNSSDWGTNLPGQQAYAGGSAPFLNGIYYPYFTLPPVTNTSPVNPAITITNYANGSTATTTPGYSANGTYTLGNAITFLTLPTLEFKLTYHSTSTGSDLSSTLDDYTFQPPLTPTSTQNWSRILPLNLANAYPGISSYYRLDALFHDPALYNLIDASSTSIFYVNIFGSTLPPPYISNPGTASTTSGSILASCNDNGINIIQGVLCWLFIPQLSSFNQFGNIYSQIINKAPIGYLTAISNVITGTATSSTPLDTLSAQLPTATSSPFIILQSDMVWILWLFFGAFVFNRIRHLNIW